MGREEKEGERRMIKREEKGRYKKREREGKLFVPKSVFELENQIENRLNEKEENRKIYAKLKEKR